MVIRIRDQDVGDVDDYHDHAIGDGDEEDNFLLQPLSGETLIAALWRWWLWLSDSALAINFEEKIL